MDPFTVIVLSIGFFLLFAGFFLAGLAYALLWLLDRICMVILIIAGKQTYSELREQRLFEPFSALSYAEKHPNAITTNNSDKWRTQCPTFYRWYQRVTGKEV